MKRYDLTEEECDTNYVVVLFTGEAKERFRHYWNGSDWIDNFAEAKIYPKFAEAFCIVWDNEPANNAKAKGYVKPLICARSHAMMKVWSV